MDLLVKTLCDAFVRGRMDWSVPHGDEGENEEHWLLPFLGGGEAGNHNPFPLSRHTGTLLEGCQPPAEKSVCVCVCMWLNCLFKYCL